MTILVAGDEFVRAELFAAAIEERLGVGASRSVPKDGQGRESVNGSDGEPVGGSDGATVGGSDGATVAGSDGATVAGSDGATVAGFGSATVAGAGSATVAGAGSATVAGAGGETGASVELRTLEFGWPTTPWREFGGVSEAAGDEATMIGALEGVRAAVTHLAPFTEKVFAHAPDLELIAVSRGGPVNVDLAAATDAGVVVCFAPGRNAQAAAEFAIGLMLATCRNIAAGHAELRTGSWPSRFFRYDEAGFELEGSTVGLVGYGAIGHIVARILTAFGARVLTFDPYADPERLEAGVERVDTLDTLLRRSRIVSLHARLTDETRGLIGAAQLAAMQPGAVLINTARGGLLDYDALADALDSGRLAGAGLDVYPSEPLPPDDRLLRTPGLVLEPHIAGASREVAERAARIAAEEIARWHAGEPPHHCANPAVLARRR